MLKKLVLLSLFLSVSNAFAAKIPLISLTADSEPGKTGYIGIYTNANHEISKIYYIDSDKDEWNYTIEELATYKTIVYKKKYELVKIKASQVQPKSANLTFRYLRSAITSEASNVTVSVRYNANLGKYQIVDSNKRPVARVQATTRYNILGVAVGIEDIQLYQ